MGGDTLGKIEYTRIEAEDEWPICPHCEAEIHNIPYFEQTPAVRTRVFLWSVKVGLFTTRVFVCPHCKKIIGHGVVRAAGTSGSP